MSAREKFITAVLLVLFLGVGLALIYEGRLLLGRFTAQASGGDPVSRQRTFPLIVGQAGNPSMPAEPSRTPMQPAANTPVAAAATPAAPTLEVPAAEPAAGSSLADALQEGWTTVTVFTPWGDSMIFSFLPVNVDFQQADFGRACPFDWQYACISTKEGGVYALAHSEYPGAVAEQARSVVEGTLYSLETIQRNVATLPGSQAEIRTAGGEVLQARVEDFTRTTGIGNMYSLAAGRAARANRLIIEFCGLPHAGDQADAAGATGSVYVLTLTEGE